MTTRAKEGNRNEMCKELENERKGCNGRCGSDQRSDRCFCRTATYDPRLRPNFTVEYERDASMRAYELIVLGRTREGGEGDGMRILVSDEGKIIYAGKPVRALEGVDIV